MIKQHIEGWAGRKTGITIRQQVGRIEIIGLYEFEGDEKDWPPEDWPAKKVQIVIGEV